MSQRTESSVQPSSSVPAAGRFGASAARPRAERLVHNLGAGCLLAALVVGGLTGWGTAAWWAVPTLVLVVALSELAVVHLQIGRQRWTFSLMEGALGAALVVSTGAWLVAAVAVGVAVAQQVRRQPALKRDFNVAQFAVAVALAQALAGHLGGGISGACAGMAVFWVVNHLLVAVAVCLTSGRPLSTLLLSNAPLSAVHTAGNTSVGLLAAFLAVHAPLGLLGLVVPLGLLWSSYDQQARRDAEARLYAELAHGQEQATGHSVDASAEVVVTAAARLLGGADVELVLLGSDGPIRYYGDESGAPESRRVQTGAFDVPWALRALGHPEVATGVDGERPWVSAVIGPADAPLAVLLALRPAGAAHFGRRETRLVDLLVGQAEAWLSVAGLHETSLSATRHVAAADHAARALGDLGAATAPALQVLRSSAGRLTRLTETDGGVEDIVEELHHVERAVASLLGAVALAAEPDLRTLPEPDETPRAEAPSDWTTTGVLQ
jgi:hypothetical protein